MLSKKFICVIAAVAALSACTTDENGGKVTTAKTQEDVKWACFGLTGALTVYDHLPPEIKGKISASTQKILTGAGVVVTNLCNNQDKLTNFNDAVSQIMDAAGQVAKAMEEEA